MGIKPQGGEGNVLELKPVGDVTRGRPKNDTESHDR